LTSGRKPSAPPRQNYPNNAVSALAKTLTKINPGKYLLTGLLVGHISKYVKIAFWPFSDCTARLTPQNIYEKEDANLLSRLAKSTSLELTNMPFFSGMD
jgi:hypothetical protein